MTAATAGPVRFARFAMPPQRLGYCGPTGAGELDGYAAGQIDGGIRELAASFEGAYPYLRLLAGSNGRDDPLDADVVEAYWIGNALLDGVTVHDFGNSIDDRFRRRAGGDWCRIDQSMTCGVANHAFHVMNVMPWSGLLRDGIVDEPLEIIDRCRISWAVVIAAGLPPTGSDPARCEGAERQRVTGRSRPAWPGNAAGFPTGEGAFGCEGAERQRVTGRSRPAWPGNAASVVVRRVPLHWSGSRLVYGTPVVEDVRTTVPVEVGDVVAVHWDWICERLGDRQLRWLRAVTDQQMGLLRAS